LYINEGFQSPAASPAASPAGSPSGSPSGVPDQSKCELLMLSYKSLVEKYNSALNVNNKITTDSMLQGIDLMKISLKSMNCQIPDNV
jgi:hypothetical protein